MFENSFRPYLPIDEIGGPKDVYTLEELRRPSSATRSISACSCARSLASAFVTVLCFVIVLSAGLLSGQDRPAEERVPTLFLLLLIPLWVSEILRSFAWFIILAYKGPLNASCSGLGIIEQPIRWLTGGNGVIVGLVYTYVLFMLFPIYNSIQSLDTQPDRGGRGSGLAWWRTHWRVILPHAKPGIASGCVMVFMLSAGSILVPTLLASTGIALVHRDHPAMDLRERRTGTPARPMPSCCCCCARSSSSLVMRLFRVKLTDIAK